MRSSETNHSIYDCSPPGRERTEWCLACAQPEEQRNATVNCTGQLAGGHYCNTSRDCPGPGAECGQRGLCSQPTNLVGTVFHPDPAGKIISVALISIFLGIVTAICLRWTLPLHPSLTQHLRVCISVCSWRKCCVCQCSVAIHCCCEPKVPSLPSLRVIPATGEQGRLTPTPTPSYMDIYPGNQ